MTDLRLLMIAPAPVLRRDGRLWLDGKFLDGMTVQAGFWPGPVQVILRAGAAQIPFGARPFDPDTSAFGLTVLERDMALTADHLRGHDLVLCSADDETNLGLPALACNAGVPVAAALEYTLGTRLRILALDRDRALPRRIYGMLKALLQDLRRHRMLAAAAGLQANGYPAHRRCRRHDPQALLFLDNRMTDDLFASPRDQAARRAYLTTPGAPLRLAYSGRLEPMKGAQDLVPVAAGLAARGVDFRMQIIGTGSLRDQIAAQIAARGLQAQVALHPPMDFDRELVPHLRRGADLYLCCHRQSDPSCTYIENMGCGLAVAGYDNAMWRDLCAASEAGWTSPLGQPDRLADTIARLDRDRAGLADRADRALAFARAHDFVALSRARMAHLEQIARQRRG